MMKLSILLRWLKILNTVFRSNTYPTALINTRTYLLYMLAILRYLESLVWYLVSKV